MAEENETNDAAQGPDALQQLAERIASKLEYAATNDRHGLRPHQIEAIKASAHHLQAPIGSEIVLPDDHPEPDDCVPEKLMHHHEIVSATGTGKTRILGALMDGSGERTLILTPRLNLNEQTLIEFSKKMDIPVEDIGIIDGTQSMSKKKEALSKRCVISTYQSLPSLVDRSPEGSRHLRKALGERPLILLDEAHTAQGPGTQSIIRDLQKNSIVIGVTATDAGVSQTLFDAQSPVFNLNLVTAIEHGLLATGVRAANVDVKIDEDWVKEMAKTRPGKEYTEENVERFARSPATLQAIAKTHLNYSDNQLGKISRFKTLVFTQGVDAAREGAKIFNEMAAEKGEAARAGWISGTMSPDEKKAILRDFESGKITMLYNDRMLEMGYDLPEASIVYSAKPTNYRHTAEQQLGRVARREGDDYFAKYGMHKVALAINVIPQGIDPFTYAHVIGGRPALYATGEEPSEHPKTDESFKKLELEGLEFHMDYKDMEVVLAGSKQNIVVPVAPEGFLTKVETAHLLRLSLNRGFVDLWKTLVEKAENAVSGPDGKVSITYNNQPVTMGYYRGTNGRASWHIDKDSIPHINSEAPRIYEGYLDFSTIHRMESFRDGRQSFIINVISRLRDAAAKAERSIDGIVNFELDGLHFNMQYGRFPAHRTAEWAVHADSLPALEELHARRKFKPDNFLSPYELADLMGVPIASPRFKSIWAQVADSRNHEPGIKAQAKLDGQSVTVGFYRYGETEGWCIGKDSLPVLQKAFQASTLTSEAFSSVLPLDIGIEDEIKQLSLKARAAPDGTVVIETIAGPIAFWHWEVSDKTRENFEAFLNAKAPEGFVGTGKLAEKLSANISDPVFASIWNSILAQAQKGERNADRTIDVPLGEGIVKMGAYRDSHARLQWHVHEDSIPVIQAELQKLRVVKMVAARAANPTLAATTQLDKPVAMRIYASTEDDKDYGNPYKTRQTFVQDQTALEALKAQKDAVAQLAKKHGLKTIDFAPHRMLNSDRYEPTATTVVDCHFALHSEDTRAPLIVAKAFAAEVEQVAGVKVKPRPLGRAKDAVQKENPLWKPILEPAKGRKPG